MPGGRMPARRLSLAVFLMGLALFFGNDLLAWFRFGFSSSLYSYTLLIPFITLYLLQDKELRCSGGHPRAWGRRGLVSAGVLFAVFALPGFGRSDPSGELNRIRLALMIVALAGGLALYWGVSGWRVRMFPVLFLFVMIPLSPETESVFNELLQRASGWLAYHLIRFTGTPVVKDGPFLILPDLFLEVAEECSGIRSTLVLLITSALMAYLFLRRAATRTAFVLAVLPLGILRNAFRILVISWLTLYVDAGVIHGPLHRRGGPLFFGLSLAILLGWGLFLRRWDKRSELETKRSGK